MSCRFHNKKDVYARKKAERCGRNMKNGSQFILMSLSNILLKRYKAIKHKDKQPILPTKGERRILNKKKFHYVALCFSICFSPQNKN